MLTTIALAAMMSVPPPSYDHDDWEGPALVCAATFSLQLEEGESMRMLFPGTALAQQSLSFFVLQTGGGQFQFLEKIEDLRVNRQMRDPVGTLAVPGARFVFETFDEDQTGFSDGDLGFAGDEHDHVERVRLVPRLQGDTARRDLVLRRLGRVPANREACTPPQ